MSKFRIGEPVRREEDFRLLRGRGRYADDVNALRQARAWVLRSPYAHADIRAIDTTAAKVAPGVLAVLTGDDLVRAASAPTVRPVSSVHSRCWRRGGYASSVSRSPSSSPRRSTRQRTHQN